MKKSAELSDESYRWKMCKDDNMRILPKEDKVWYLSNNPSTRYMPNTLIAEDDSDSPNTHPKIIMPRRMVDVFDRHSITLAGFGLHHRGYYHSRKNSTFTDFICVISGSFIFKCENKRTVLKRGDALILPPNCVADSFVEARDAYVFWVHFKNIPFWNSLIGGLPYTKKVDNFQKILFLMETYKEEVYSRNRSVHLLETLADSLEIFFRREFCGRNNSIERNPFDRFADKISENLNFEWKTADAARVMNVDVKTLELFCKKYYQLSFPKFVAKLKMRRALNMLKSGSSNADIAQAIGYSSAYAFSKAFKLFYGKSPRNYISER